MVTRAPRMSRREPEARGPVCPACGRCIQITWPARSLLCRCGAQVLPRPSSAPEPGFLRHGTGILGKRTRSLSRF